MRRVQEFPFGVAPSWAIWPVAAMAAALLSGCLATTNNPEPPPPARAGPVAKPVALAEMGGRWLLASPGASACGMTFSGAPGAIEGTIAPEGGCPGSFFTSRRWAFDQSALIIRNHNGEPLARLALSGTGRFDGQASTGEPISLAR
jgi:hypothetical protein